MAEKTTTAVDDTSATSEHHGFKDLASRLYRGEAGLDIVGKRKYAYAFAGIVLLVAIASILLRPPNLGIEFKGGETFTLPASVGTLDDARTAIANQGAAVASGQKVGGVGGGTGDSYQIKTAVLDSDPTVAANKAITIRQNVAKQFHISEGQISEEAVSGAWSSTVTTTAGIGALVFLGLVVIYLGFVFREWRMPVAALAALAQNLVLTAAIYLLIGFEVTPSTVIGFLTILGFALYDVVVVFDKVRENTKGITGNPNRTYGEASNLAVNQTLMRSINTAVVALLPVGGLLFIGAGLLGAGTLKDLGLVLFVGMLVAVYSSIFFATPVLVDLKEREPRFKLHKQRVLQRRQAALTGGTRKGSKTAKSKVAVEDVDDDQEDDVDDTPELASAGAGARSGANRPQPRKRTNAGGRSGGRPRGGGRSGRRR
jgi:preprotein translocase subunit SecF